MKVNYDILDDLEIDDSQTSSSDLISSDRRPVDDYPFVLKLNTTISTLENELLSIEYLMSSCVEDFSEPEFDNRIVRIGFENSFISPKSLLRFINSLEARHMRYAISEGEKTFVDSIRLKYNNPLEKKYALTKLAYRLFHFEKFGFRVHDTFIKESPEELFKTIAYSPKILASGEIEGPVDITFLNTNNDEILPAEYGYMDMNVPKIRSQQLFSLDEYVFRNEPTQLSNFRYQLSADRNGDFIYFDVFLGSVYIAEIDNVIDLVIGITFSNRKANLIYDKDLKRFREKMNRIFGGRTPEVVMDLFENEIIHRRVS